VIPLSSADGGPEGEAEAAGATTDELRDELLGTLTDALGDAIVGSHVRPGDDLWVRVDRSAWREAAEAARGQLGCTYFCFLSAIDWLPSPFGRSEDSPVGDDPAPAPTEVATGYAGGDTRFQVLARVESPTRHLGVTFKADLPDDDLRIASWTPTYLGADWHEREAWEMFGIEFDGHPNLRHLYLPGQFEGHPLRKDFALLARQVKPWPGIVDVEPMPEDDEPDAEQAEAGDTTEASA
jgi:NADH-quinone oxidoreductase subunit C